MHQSTGLLKGQLVLRIDPKKKKELQKNGFHTRKTRTMAVEVEEEFGGVCRPQQIQFHPPRISVHQTLFAGAV